MMFNDIDVTVRRALPALGLALLLLASGSAAAPESATLAVIVQGADSGAAVAAVRNVGATVTHELGIIRAAGARVTAAQRAALAESRAVTRVYADRRVGVASGNGGGAFFQPEGALFPAVVAADLLHREGIDGYGVTVAVLDTGHYSHRVLNRDTRNRWRLLAQYDAVAGREIGTQTTDESGHAAHVTS